MTASPPLVVYGLGTVGQQVVDELLDKGTAVELILDRGKDGQDYRGVSVRSLDSLDGQELTGQTVLVALHNHYVDLKEIERQLVGAGAARVMSMVQLPELIVRPRTRPGYWLDPDFDYRSRRANLERVRQLLADDTSRDLWDAILRYRQGGALADCPDPSLADEYTPSDLPRFAGPLRLIDCGAFTGVAVQKFLKAGYPIDRLIAFEPDAASYATLATRDLPIASSLCLPLGTWSATTQLKFAGGSSMASHLSEAGDTTIQCVAIDDVLRGEAVNLIKLDVEGAEIETLKGARRTIHKQRPNLLVSAYHQAGHLHEIAELIDDWQLGYRFHLRVHEYNTFGLVLYALQSDRLETD